ncbi:MAG TPA: 16S rRNA (guanine(527)-N(7))-methyltransferase RsmG [Ignavibacteriaceae bacterium]|jgi:16S rRNA (guanine527-N7)-methyltransferase|nr:16S rRNA (guanine(527)-N(7))-methyltransferase RsmG [Ignavibacteriaceae bacterium]
MVDVQEQYLKELQSFYWENGFTPDIMKVERLAYFAELVAEKNESVNLISRRDIGNIIENHVFLCSYLTRYIPAKATHFLDIGTGGGFPGIPLAILRPELQGVLVDSTNKKINAVEEFIDKLKLGNVIAENERVESPEFIEKYKDSFDLIISRASVPLIILFRYALPLIKEKAYLVAIKGGDLDTEYRKAEMKYKSYIKKSTIFELYYKPTNVRNQKGKKLVLLELYK